MVGLTLDPAMMHEISKKLPSLEWFTVDEKSQTPPEDFDWSWLERFSNLTYLAYRPQNTTNAVLRSFSALKKLKILNFSTAQSEDPADFGPLATLTNLESLYIQMNKQHRNLNESVIGDLIKLQILTVMEGPIRGFTEISRLTNLIELQLDTCAYNQIIQVHNLTSLKSLSVGGPDLLNFPWRNLKLDSVEKLELKGDLFSCKYYYIYIQRKRIYGRATPCKST